MPVTSQDELMQAVVGGEIGAISIDTSVFESYKFGFEVGVLAQLSQFARSDIQHLLVDMVRHEIQSHMTAQGKEDKAKVKNAMKPLLNSWGIAIEARDATLNTLFGEGDEVARTDQRLKSFVESSAAVVVESGDFVDLERVIDMYFKSSPPFGAKESKKREFPDALALLSLEGWAKDNQTMVLVVAKDPDWRKFCESSELLFYADDLPTALSAFHAGADTAAKMFFKAVKENHIAHIGTTVLEALNEQANSNYYFESELAHVEITEATPIHEQLENLEVVDYENNELLLRANIRCNVEAQFSVSFDQWDGIDKEYLSIGSATLENKEEVELEVLLTVLFQNGTASIEKVELVSMVIGMEFGEIGPDWMHEQEE
jgi:hypothetical protein